jgi:hypothetical protein
MHIGSVVVATFRDLTQVLACADLCREETLRWYDRVLRPRSGRVWAVYSDPPWNPGNEKYWRTHATAAVGAELIAPSGGYDAFQAGWCGAAALAVQNGAQHLLVEQAANPDHQAYLVRGLEVAGVDLPLQDTWMVHYGGTGKAARQRPNTLMHFGRRRLTTDPSDMNGESMTTRAMMGLGLRAGDVVVEPCVGKGMTSRTAHALGVGLVGTELNPMRLAESVRWLECQGYTITSETM